MQSPKFKTKLKALLKWGGQQRPHWGVIAVVVFWTLCYAGALMSTWHILNQRAYDTMTAVAKEALFRDMSYIRWNISHHGVLVSAKPQEYVSKRLPWFNPNVQLNEKETLWVIGPVVMLEQVARYTDSAGQLTRIVGPNEGDMTLQGDPWEQAALKEFEKEGKKAPKAISEIQTDEDGREVFRMIRPIAPREICIQCNQNELAAFRKNYAALSVTIPTDSLTAAERVQKLIFLLSYTALWVLGTTAIIHLGTLLTRRDRVQRKAIKTLSSRNERYADIVESTNTIFWETDQECKLAFVSNGVSKFLGVDPIQLFGVSPYDIIYPDDVQHVQAVVAKASQGVNQPAQVINFECRFLDAHDNVRWMNVYGRPNPGGPKYGYKGSMFDVTDRVLENERYLNDKLQAEARDREKNEFLSKVNSEIRTPVDNLTRISETLLHEEAEPAAQDMARRIVSSSSGLLGALDDIFDFTALQNGALTLDRSSFAVRPLIDETSDMLAATAAQKHIELIVDVENTVPEKCEGDAGKLRRLLLNLLENALKFTKNGYILIHVYVRAHAKYGQSLYFTVADTGEGMRADVKAKIASAFSSDKLQSETGLGLGLSVSREIIRLWGGRFYCRSAVNKGTCISFTMPLVGAVYSQKNEYIEGAKVLLLDGRERVAKRLRWCLKQRGVLVEWVNTLGRLSVRLIDQQREEVPYRALIVSDWHNAPDGISDLDKVRDHIQLALGAEQQLPAIRIGSVNQPEEYRQAARLGYWGYLIRPIVLSDWLKAIAWIGEGQKISGLVTQHLLRAPIEVSSSLQPAAEEIAVTESPLSVLVAEDNPVNQHVAKAMLRKLGLNAYIVNNGEEAVGFVEETPVDLILMDCQMPVMDGFTATRTIRNLDAKLDRHTLIIGMATLSKEPDADEWRSAGMDDLIDKPLKIMDVRILLKKYFS